MTKTSPQQHGRKNYRSAFPKCFKGSNIWCAGKMCGSTCPCRISWQIDYSYSYRSWKSGLPPSKLIPAASDVVTLVAPARTLQIAPYSALTFGARQPCPNSFASTGVNARRSWMRNTAATVFVCSKSAPMVCRSGRVANVAFMSMSATHTGVDLRSMN